jgi:hypothetical protein
MHTGYPMNRATVPASLCPKAVATCITRFNAEDITALHKCLRCFSYAYTTGHRLISQYQAPYVQWIICIFLIINFRLSFHGLFNGVSASGLHTVGWQNGKGGPVYSLREWSKCRLVNFSQDSRYSDRALNQANMKINYQRQFLIRNYYWLHAHLLIQNYYWLHA